jgi:hypothetical protein
MNVRRENDFCIDMPWHSNPALLPSPAFYASRPGRIGRSCMNKVARQLWRDNIHPGRDDFAMDVCQLMLDLSAG